jgi:hypothetical protein
MRRRTRAHLQLNDLVSGFIEKVKIKAAKQMLCEEAEEDDDAEDGTDAVETVGLQQLQQRTRQNDVIGVGSIVYGCQSDETPSSADGTERNKNCEATVMDDQLSNVENRLQKTT